MKYLLIVLLIISCGKQKIEVNDSKQTVDVNINWNLDEFNAAFRDSCETKFDTQDEVEQCITDKITNLTDLINEGINNNKQEV